MNDNLALTAIQAAIRHVPNEDYMQVVEASEYIAERLTLLRKYEANEISIRG